MPQHPANILTDTVDQLRRYDPIETAAARPVALGELALHGVLTVSDALESDAPLSAAEKSALYKAGCDSYLDILYGDKAEQVEGAQFTADLDKAQKFFGEALQHAEQNERQDPQHLWGLRVKHLDLRALQAHRNAQDSQTILKGTEAGQKTWALAEHQMRGVLRDTLPLMYSIAQRATGPSMEAAKARGTLYETLMVAYARLRTYENETFDTTFVRSALDREDRPLPGRVMPRRAYDMVIELNGMPARLLQLKNHNSDTPYAYPIEKVQDVNFGQTLQMLPQYIADYSLLVQNPADPKVKPYLDQAAARLDGVFGEQLQM